MTNKDNQPTDTGLPDNSQSNISQASKSISAILKPSNEDNPNGACEIYISPELTYPDIIQLLGTLMLHTMNSFYQVYAHQIKSVNLNQKLRTKNPTAPNSLPKDAVMTDKELDAAIASAGYQIYDSMNIAVSSVLNEFLNNTPNLSFLNPEDLITEQAILNAEEQCLNDALDSLPEEQKQVAQQHLNSIKAKIKESKDNFARMQLENEQQSNTQDAE